MRLLPREEKFFHLFPKQVEIISEASRLLLEGAQDRKFQTRRRCQPDQQAGTPGRRNHPRNFHAAQPDVHHAARSGGYPQPILQHWITCSTASRILRTAWSPTGSNPIPPDMVALGDRRQLLRHPRRRPSRRWKRTSPIMEHCIEINRLENEADLIGAAPWWNCSTRKRTRSR